MDHDRLERAREGDLDAFLELVRPRAGRLLRLAAVGAGEPAVARRAALAAIRTAWRDVRRTTSAAALEERLERALVLALPRALPRAHASPGAPDPLHRTLARLRPGDRVALGRCLDPQPDPEALAVAGRAGVEVDAGSGPSAPGGGIVDLDGPLAGWDLARLRAALGAAARAAAPDMEDLLDAARGELRGRRPQARPVAALRALLPGPAALVRGTALAAAALVGMVALVVGPSAPGPGAGDPAGSAAVDAGTGGAPGRQDVTGRPGAPDDADTPGDFPATVEGLAVIGVAEARGLAGDAAAAGRSLAIRGWLAPPELAEPCLAPSPVAPGRAGMAPLDPAPVAVDDPLDPAAAFCLRDTVLRADPGSAWRGAHLHPRLLPGTGLGRARRVFAAMDGRPVAVVVLAHFGDPRVVPCAPGGRHCGEEIVIERIAWVSGASARPAVAVRSLAPGMGTRRSGQDAMAIVEEAFGGLRAVAATGVPVGELGAIEPDAAGLEPPSGFGWLVRAIAERRADDPPGARRTWLVVDDRSGRIVGGPDVAIAARPEDGVGAGTGFLFPRRTDGSLVRTPAEVAALVRSGLPEGTALAVAGWLGTPSLAGACLPEAAAVAGPLEDSAAFCRRSVVLRGPTPDGRALALQLPPGVPTPPLGDAVAARSMPVPVVALVVAGSPRAEPCLPGREACTRPLALERLLWVDGVTPGVPVATLDAPGSPAPRLAVGDVRAIAAVAAGERPLVSIVRVPAARRAQVVPGAAAIPVEGDHAWIVHVLSALESPPAGGGARLELAWWLLVDDATGRVALGSGTPADFPDLPPPATPPG